MIEERYIAATQASHLRDEPYKIGQVDIIKASGMSSRNMAAHYLRLISKPTKEDMARVYAALLYVVESRKLASGEEVVGTAMDWLLTQTCSVCAGTGVVIKKAIEQKCPRCNGMGRRREPSNKDAQILIDYVMTCRAAHAGRMVAKMK